MSAVPTGGYLAYIIPAAHPEHPIVYPPPGQPGGQPPWYPGHPEHPIPPGVWPTPPGQQPGVPTHPIAYPPWWPGTPTHPIPPGIWPSPPQPGGAPGYPSHPIFYPGFPGTPTHPIPPTIWPEPPIPGVIVPPPHVEHPIPPTIWPTPPGPPPGGQTGSPSHPIELPPTGLPTAGFWALAYFHQTQVWTWVLVPVAPEQRPTAAAPAGKK
jgi:hypothetical protein